MRPVMVMLFAVLIVAAAACGGSTLATQQSVEAALPADLGSYSPEEQQETRPALTC